MPNESRPLGARIVNPTRLAVVLALAWMDEAEAAPMVDASRPPSLPAPAPASRERAAVWRARCFIAGFVL